MNTRSIWSVLTDHPYWGPFLTVGRYAVRSNALLRHAAQLEDELGADHPQVALARSWYAVSHGAEAFDEHLLEMLREAEVVIREHFPEARRALAMNLAAQGCHTWFLHTKQEAIGPLALALQIMLADKVAIEADIVKVAEVLADCFADVGAFDDAVLVLDTVQPYILAAREQEELTVARYEEFRVQFIEQHGDECSSELLPMVEALRGPRLSDACLR